MSKTVITAAATFFVASTVAVSAGHIGFGVGGIGILIGPGFQSGEPSREYHRRVRTHQEEASRPRRQHQQHNDDEKAEAVAPAKSHANENSSIAILTGRPEGPNLRPQNSSIAIGPQPVRPAQSASLTAQNSSIAIGPQPVEPAQSASLTVRTDSPEQQAVSSPPVLCSRYFPTAGQTMRVPCE
jgi:hypothetical protein